MNMVWQTNIWQIIKLTSFGATGRCVLLSSSLSTSMYLLESYYRVWKKQAKQAQKGITAHIKEDVTHFSSMLSFSFWSASKEMLFPWFAFAEEHDNVRQNRHHTAERRCVWCVAEPHIERRWAELDVPLDDETHRFLHVPLGNGQSAASLWQATLWKHLQQVLLLGLPTPCWWLHMHHRMEVNIMLRMFRD